VLEPIQRVPAAGSREIGRMEAEMPIEKPHLRHNYLAIAVAAVTCFLLFVAWYSIFLETWLAGIGHNREWLAGLDVSLPLQCVTALVSALLLAICISAFTQLTGPMTAMRGVKIAFGLWLGCVLTTRATQNVFEAHSYSHFALNTGFWLLAMTMMGAIVGGWKKAGARD
jgi:hypothetical protein